MNIASVCLWKISRCYSLLNNLYFLQVSTEKHGAPVGALTPCPHLSPSRLCVCLLACAYMFPSAATAGHSVTVGHGDWWGCSPPNELNIIRAIGRQFYIPVSEGGWVVQRNQRLLLTEGMVTVTRTRTTTSPTDSRHRAVHRGVVTNVHILCSCCRPWSRYGISVETC